MSGTLSLGTIAGIRVRVSSSWLVILALLTATLATGWFPQAADASTATYLALGALGALLFFASVAVHEVARVAVARYRGLTVRRVALYAFGGVSDLDRQPRAPGEEFQLAVAGPLANFILAWIAGALQGFVLGQNDLLAALLYFLSVSNALLGLINLIPGYPLDGGRVLRAFLWRSSGDLAGATRRAALAGQVAAYLLILWGIWRFFSAEPTPGLWLVVSGFLLLDAARATSGPAGMASALAGVTVGEVMRPAGATARAAATLQQLVDEHVLSQGMWAVPVAQGERVVGLITLADALRTPRDQWARTPISRAMTPLERLYTTTPEGSAAAALSAMARRDLDQAPVLRDGRLVGLLGRADILAFLEPRADPPSAEAERAAEVIRAG